MHLSTFLMRQIPVCLRSGQLISIFLILKFIRHVYLSRAYYHILGNISLGCWQLSSPTAIQGGQPNTPDSVYIPQRNLRADHIYTQLHPTTQSSRWQTLQKGPNLLSQGQYTALSKGTLNPPLRSQVTQNHKSKIQKVTTQWHEQARRGLNQGSRPKLQEMQKIYLRTATNKTSKQHAKALDNWNPWEGMYLLLFFHPTLHSIKYSHSEEK